MDKTAWIDRFEAFSTSEDTAPLILQLSLLMESSEPQEGREVLKGEDVAVLLSGGDRVLMTLQLSVGLRVAYERRFCVTKKGYVGLVPPLTVIGDRLCLFFGGDTPFLVRPTAPTTTTDATIKNEHVVVEEDADASGSAAPAVETLRCELVGECYVHGMMDGEMMGQGFKTVRFHLV